MTPTRVFVVAPTPTMRAGLRFVSASPAMRAKVRQAMADLGYRPHAAARDGGGGCGLRVHRRRHQRQDSGNRRSEREASDRTPDCVHDVVTLLP